MVLFICLLTHCYSFDLRQILIGNWNMDIVRVDKPGKSKFGSYQMIINETQNELSIFIFNNQSIHLNRSYVGKFAQSNVLRLFEEDLEIAQFNITGYAKSVRSEWMKGKSFIASIPNSNSLYFSLLSEDNKWKHYSFARTEDSASPDEDSITSKIYGYVFFGVTMALCYLLMKKIQIWGGKKKIEDAVKILKDESKKND